MSACFLQHTTIHPHKHRHRHRHTHTDIYNGLINGPSLAGVTPARWECTQLHELSRNGVRARIGTNPEV